MNEPVSAEHCPFRDAADQRKSADIAMANTQPDEGAHWVRSPNVARHILRSQHARQAGASADVLKYDNPEHAPVFFLDGEEHARKRRKTQRFLSPKAVSEQHFQMMRRVSDHLLEDFRQSRRANLEDISFSLAIEVVGEILGLTNSDQAGRARRVQRVLAASLGQAGDSPLARSWLNLRRLFHMGMFYLFDIRPAINARKATPRDDAISVYLDEGYNTMSILVECLTYGTAGMLTTREFIVMAAWYLFEDQALRQRFLDGDIKAQLAVLLEILRLEPVAAMIHRRVYDEVEGVEDSVLPPGEKYGIDIRAANVHEEMVGECPYAVDPDRAQREQNSGRFLSFGDGIHSCPGWQVALHETRIFLEQLFVVPGLRLEREPDMGWNDQLGSYELRNAVISCD